MTKKQSISAAQRARTSDAAMRRWKHNSFSGHVKMAQRNMQSISTADSTTAFAKDSARKILFELDLLEKWIKERVD